MRFIHIREQIPFIYRKVIGENPYQTAALALPSNFMINGHFSVIFVGTMCSFSHSYLFVVSTFNQLTSEKKQNRNVNLTHFRQTPELKVCFVFLHIQALHQREWNITAVTVSSTEIHVSWFRFNTSNSNSSYIYGYVAALQMLRIGTGDILVLNVINAPVSNLNSSFFGTLVSGLRPYTKYGVKVVALVRDRMTGVISLKISSINEVQTLEGGE